jgi:hypothetical protein
MIALASGRALSPGFMMCSAKKATFKTGIDFAFNI